MQMYVLQTSVLLAFAFVYCAQGVQIGTQASDGLPEMEPRELDMKEVEERGSHCLDGSAPIYHHKVGTQAGRWIIWLNPGNYCSTPEGCANKLPVHPNRGRENSLPLQLYGEFKEYHHVVIDNCDLGLYMGDVDEPIYYKGTKLYFQGSRIVKHVIDVLSGNYPMTDVLVSGGSGGAQSIHVGADYIRAIMPKSVKKFGIVPINGFGQGNWDIEVKNAYSLHGMGNHAPVSCTKANPEEPHVCIKPAEAYKHTKVSTFFVQIFDHTFRYVRNDLFDVWEQCMGLIGKSPTRSCRDEDAQTLSKYFDDFVLNVTKSPKFHFAGQGGFISTCTIHNFYLCQDSFNGFAIHGLTVPAAIARWWQALETDPRPKWHLPCHLGKTVKKLQCEPSCHKRFPALKALDSLAE